MVFLNIFSNKPLLVAGILEDIVSVADRLSKKWTVGQEVKLQGQLWNFENNLSAQDIMSSDIQYQQARKGCIYFITLPSNHYETKFVWNKPNLQRYWQHILFFFLFSGIALEMKLFIALLLVLAKQFPWFSIKLLHFQNVQFAYKY